MDSSVVEGCVVGRCDQGDKKQLNPVGGVLGLCGADCSSKNDSEIIINYLKH